MPALPGRQAGEVPEGLVRRGVVGHLGPLARCFGCRFSATDDRPKKPVPIVIVGARFVSMPELPRLLPTLTDDPQDPHGGAVVHDRPRVRAVDRGRVAGAGDAQHRAGRIDAAARVRHRDQAQHRAELLVRQRLLGDDEVERGQQDPGGAGDPDAGLGRDEGGILADEAQVEAPRRETSVSATVVASSPRPAGRRPPDSGGAAGCRPRPARTISTDSFVHRIELSKLLESTMRLAALRQVGASRRRARARCPGRRRCAGVPEL